MHDTYQHTIYPFKLACVLYFFYFFPTQAEMMGYTYVFFFLDQKVLNLPDRIIGLKRMEGPQGGILDRC